MASGGYLQNREAKQWDNCQEHKNDGFELIYCCQQLQFWGTNVQTAVMFSCQQIKLLKAFVQPLLGNVFKRSYEFFLYLNLFCKKLLNLVLILFMNMLAK